MSSERGDDELARLRQSDEPAIRELAAVVEAIRRQDEASLAVEVSIKTAAAIGAALAAMASDADPHEVAKLQAIKTVLESTSDSIR
jgi:hypothetical protein